MSKDTKKPVRSIWDMNPKLKSYHQTSDGEKFYMDHDAKTHARSLEDDSITEVKRPVKVVKLSAEERIEAISTMETVAEVEAALKGETAKTVKEAGEARIVELNAAE